MKTVSDAQEWARRLEPANVYISSHPGRTKKALLILSEEIEKLQGVIKELIGCHTEHGTPKLCDGCLISAYSAIDAGDIESEI